MDKKGWERVDADKIFSHYKKTEEGKYIIELQIPTIEHLFSKHDPAPLHQRDLDSEIARTIISQMVVFPHHAEVELHLHLPKKLQKHKYEEQLVQAVKHHFEYELLDCALHLKRRIRKGLKQFAVAGMIFLTLFTSSYFLAQTDNVLLHLLAEGFMIGSWVSLWHPIETLLYDWLPLYEDTKKYHKLIDMNIRFKYV